MTVQSIEQAFWELQSDIDVECDDTDYDSSSCMNEEKEHWLQKLLAGEEMEIKDWSKLRKEIKGL